jgi:hypothetical protein
VDGETTGVMLGAMTVRVVEVAIDESFLVLLVVKKVKVCSNKKEI